MSCFCKFYKKIWPCEPSVRALPGSWIIHLSSTFLGRRGEGNLDSTPKTKIVPPHQSRVIVIEKLKDAKD